MAICDVILVNYNKVDFIEQCLRSLLAQTAKEWRCVVIDGFSDDGSWELLRKFSFQDARFELHQIQREESLYAAWNHGLDNVKNPYFCILTSDDWWEPNWLARATTALEVNENAIAVAARTTIVDSLGRTQPQSFPAKYAEKFFQISGQREVVIKGWESCLASYFLGPIFLSAHSLCVRSSVLSKGLWFSLDVKSAADYEWYLSLGRFGDVVYEADVNAFWRKCPGQASDRVDWRMHESLMRCIRERARPIVASVLENCEAEFIRLSEEFENSVLSYEYVRPWLCRFKSSPMSSWKGLLDVLRMYPIRFFKDCCYRSVGRNLVYEEGLAYCNRLRARKALESLEDSSC